MKDQTLDLYLIIDQSCRGNQWVEDYRAEEWNTVNKGKVSRHNGACPASLWTENLLESFDGEVGS